MKRTLILVAGAVLSIASAAARPEKLTTLPPGFSGTLDAAVPAARRALEKALPDTKVVTAAPAEADWEIQRNDATGIVLRRLGTIGFGLRTGDRCWFQLRVVYQESLPDGWGPLELADTRWLENKLPERDLAHGDRYSIACAAVTDRL